MKCEDEVQKVSQEFKRIRQNGGKIVFPLHLKVRVLALLDAGHSIPSLCKQLNLCKSQMYSWKSYLQQEPTPHIKKSSYEIKSIPLVPSVAEAGISNLERNKKKRPQVFFRFLSLKITWG